MKSKRKQIFIEYWEEMKILWEQKININDIVSAMEEENKGEKMKRIRDIKTGVYKRKWMVWNRETVKQYQAPCHNDVENLKYDMVRTT